MPAEVSSVGPNPPRSPCFRRAPLPSLWCEPQVNYFYVLAPFGGNQFSILLILLFGWLAGWLDPGFVHYSYVLNWLADWVAGWVSGLAGVLSGSPGWLSSKVDCLAAWPSWLAD